MEGLNVSASEKLGYLKILLPKLNKVLYTMKTLKVLSFFQDSGKTDFFLQILRNTDVFFTSEKS